MAQSRTVGKKFARFSARMERLRNSDHVKIAMAKLNAEAALKFLNSRRILPRRVAAYGLPDCLRVTIAEADAVKACAQAIEDFVKGAATQ